MNAHPPVSFSPHDVLVGANPIIWSNDDFNELNGDLPLDVLLSEMRAAGYAGSELGHAYPRTPDALAAAFARHDLRLVSGWHSTYFASRPLPDEEASLVAHLKLLKTLGARVAIVAECTHCIHGDRAAALGFGDKDSTRLSDPEWTKLIAGLRHACRIAALHELRLVYHHHMGTVIQSEAEIDRLLASVPELSLVLDPGHLAFAGIDPLSVIAKHGPRIAHVHLKSVRPEIAARVRSERWSFCRAVTEGVFTAPGLGCVDFAAIFAALHRLSYRGWLVVEAEEDPAKAPPFEKAVRARQYVREQTGV